MQNEYNSRLFESRGLRRKIHEGRFLWLNDILTKNKIANSKVLELGCFDGKTINYLPQKPEFYSGYDANWEKGFDLAKVKWEGHPNFEFIESSSINTFNPKNDFFDIAISMETLEHLPDQELEEYIKKVANSLKPSGHFIVTIPNEQGLLFALKYLTKGIFYKNSEKYNFKEFIWATLGYQRKVERIKGGHKGFDQNRTIALINKYFSKTEISSIPFTTLPSQLSVTIGITATQKK